MRFACCNELFEGWELTRQLRFLSEVGYEGVELAPFTIASAVTAVSPGQRADIRQLAADHGLTVTGIHWLLARTTGLHVTSPDTATRRRTADYLCALVEFCADVGGKVMVFGSPQQRNLAPGVTAEQGRAWLIEVLSRVLPVAAGAQVTFCLEPLGGETNFLQTTDEAISVLNEVAHPNLRLILDVKAMASQAVMQNTTIADIVRGAKGHVAYSQANDANRGAPGSGDTDFVPIFAALRDIGYDDWMSVEVFDFSAGPERIARDSLAYLRRAYAAAAGEPRG